MRFLLAFSFLSNALCCGFQLFINFLFFLVISLPLRHKISLAIVAQFPAETLGILTKVNDNSGSFFENLKTPSRFPRPD